MVSLTYGHGKLYDFESVTGWTEHEDGNTASFATDGDVTTITVTVSAGNKTYYMDNDDNLGLSTSTYTKILGRYKTSDTNIKAEVVLEFSDAATQTVLAETSSTTWQTFSATITTAKTLDHIRLHADQATGTVEYDFVLVYQADFTFPSNQPEEMTFNPCPPRIAFLDVPGRSGDITQGLATHSSTVDMICDLDIGTWTRASNPADYIKGEVFIDIAHNLKDEPWQWFDSEYEQFKATLTDCRFVRRGDRHLLYVTFTEYRLGSAAAEEWYDRFGLKL